MIQTWVSIIVFRSWNDLLENAEVSFMGRPKLYIPEHTKCRSKKRIRMTVDYKQNMKMTE